MGARTAGRATTADTEPDSRARQSGYGVPSPVLLALADRGFARFLEGVTEPGDDDGTAGGHDDAARHP